MRGAYQRVFGFGSKKQARKAEKEEDEVSQLRTMVTRYEEELDQASSTIILQDKAMTKLERLSRLVVPTNENGEPALKDREPPSPASTSSEVEHQDRRLTMLREVTREMMSEAKQLGISMSEESEQVVSWHADDDSKSDLQDRIDAMEKELEDSKRTTAEMTVQFDVKDAGQHSPALVDDLGRENEELKHRVDILERDLSRARALHDQENAAHADTLASLTATAAKLKNSAVHDVPGGHETEMLRKHSLAMREREALHIEEKKNLEYVVKSRDAQVANLQATKDRVSTALVAATSAHKSVKESLAKSNRGLEIANAQIHELSERMKTLARDNQATKDALQAAILRVAEAKATSANGLKASKRLIDQRDGDIAAIKHRHSSSLGKLEDARKEIVRLRTDSAREHQRFTHDLTVVSELQTRLDAHVASQAAHAADKLHLQQQLNKAHMKLRQLAENQTVPSTTDVQSQKTIEDLIAAQTAHIADKMQLQRESNRLRTQLQEQLVNQPEMQQHDNINDLASAQLAHVADKMSMRRQLNKAHTVLRQQTEDYAELQMRIVSSPREADVTPTAVVRTVTAPAAKEDIVASQLAHVADNLRQLNSFITSHEEIRQHLNTHNRAQADAQQSERQAEIVNDFVNSQLAHAAEKLQMQRQVNRHIATHKELRQQLESIIAAHSGKETQQASSIITQEELEQLSRSLTHAQDEDAVSSNSDLRAQIARLTASQIAHAADKLEMQRRLNRHISAYDELHWQLTECQVVLEEKLQSQNDDHHAAELSLIHDKISLQRELNRHVTLHSELHQQVSVSHTAFEGERQMQVENYNASQLSLVADKLSLQRQLNGHLTAYNQLREQHEAYIATHAAKLEEQDSEHTAAQLSHVADKSALQRQLNKYVTAYNEKCQQFEHHVTASEAELQLRNDDHHASHIVHASDKLDLQRRLNTQDMVTKEHSQQLNNSITTLKAELQAQSDKHHDSELAHIADKLHMTRQINKHVTAYEEIRQQLSGPVVPALAIEKKSDDNRVSVSNAGEALNDHSTCQISHVADKIDMQRQLNRQIFATKELRQLVASHAGLQNRLSELAASNAELNQQNQAHATAQVAHVADKVELRRELNRQHTAHKELHQIVDAHSDAQSQLARCRASGKMLEARINTHVDSQISHVADKLVIQRELTATKTMLQGKVEEHSMVVTQLRQHLEEHVAERANLQKQLDESAEAHATELTEAYSRLAERA